MYPSDKFDIIDYNHVCTVIGGFNNKPINKWINNDSKLVYERFEFVGKPNIYNTFIQSPYDRQTTEQLTERMPLFNEYISTVMTTRECDLEFLQNWISWALNDGKTGIALILMGLKGTGKDFFTIILERILGNQDYFRRIGNIKQINDTFNAQEERNIFTSIQEINCDDGSYHSTQNRLKTLVTEETLTLRKMHTNPYNIKSNSNIILSTNFEHPVQITDDNRRYFPRRLTNAQRNNKLFYGSLLYEVESNIEYLRGYFINRPYDTRICIPDSELLQGMMNMSRQFIDTFISEHLPDIFNTEYCEQDNIYQLYKTRHMEAGETSRYLSKKYFRQMVDSSDNDYKFTFASDEKNQKRIWMLTKNGHLNGINKPHY